MGVVRYSMQNGYLADDSMATLESSSTIYDGYMSLHSPQMTSAYAQHFHVTQPFAASYPQSTATRVNYEPPSFPKSQITKQQREENNMRERNRVKKINRAFERLSQKISPYTDGHKLTKLTILQESIRLIDRLQNELNGGIQDQPVDQDQFQLEARMLSRMRSDGTTTTTQSNQSL